MTWRRATLDEQVAQWAGGLRRVIIDDRTGHWSVHFGKFGLRMITIDPLHHRGEWLAQLTGYQGA